MITKKESKLGRLMSYAWGIGFYMLVLVQLLLVKPNPLGFNVNFLELRTIIFVLILGAGLFVVALNLKLFNEKENPVFRVLSYIFFVMYVAICMFIVAPLAAKYSLIALSLTPITLVEILNALMGLLLPIYGLYFLSIAQIENGKLPRYGKIIFVINGSLALFCGIGGLFGLLPAAVYNLLFLIGALVTHAACTILLAKMYGNTAKNL